MENVLAVDQLSLVDYHGDVSCMPISGDFMIVYVSYSVRGFMLIDVFIRIIVGEIMLDFSLK